MYQEPLAKGLITGALLKIYFLSGAIFLSKVKQLVNPSKLNDYFLKKFLAWLQ